MTRTVKLLSGHEMPLLGLGTWQSKKGEVKAAVKYAISIGYRHIDCAWAYRNEDEIGEALEEVFQEKLIKREELFITSKLWNSFHRPEEVNKGVQECLKDLKIDYLDLYLIHWPVQYKPGVLFPSKESVQGDIDDVDFLLTWKEMEKLVDQGLVKSIGLSNFNIKQTQQVLDKCRIRPSMMQVEVHTHFPNKELVEFCWKNDIQVTAYSPLGAPDRPEAKPEDKGPLTNPHVLEIAKKLNMTAGQVLIRYVIQRGIICIPKSVTPSRIKDNFQTLTLELPKEDFEVLDNLGINHRFVVPSIMAAHKDYPFEEK